MWFPEFFTQFMPGWGINIALIIHSDEALLAVADKESSLIISGNGDVIEPEQGIMAIGSGGNYALSAARALFNNTELDARSITEKSLGIAADICIYTNHNLLIEELEY